MVPEMEEIGIRITVIFFRGQAGLEFQANTIDSIELIEKGGIVEAGISGTIGEG